MDLSPIVLFVYNRPWHTEQTLNALMLNQLAEDSVLYIYSDGPKETASEKEKLNISSVRKILYSKQWCKEVHILQSESNKGLAKSIIEGVTNILERHSKIIVLEDDIVTSHGFLKYMNDALSFYKNSNEVMHISGYMYPHNKELPETFFFNVPLCWGWATWRRSWDHFEKGNDILIRYLDASKNWSSIDKFGQDILSTQLKQNFTGELNTWFIKWHVSVFKQGGYTLYPKHSLVNNIGFDSSGIHNGTTAKFLHENLSSSVRLGKIPIQENKEAAEVIEQFYLPPVQIDFNRKNNWKSKCKRILKKMIPFKSKVMWEIKQSVLQEIPLLTDLSDTKINRNILFSSGVEMLKGINTKVSNPFQLNDVLIGKYSYIASNSNISFTRIGKFCSIGPNFLCGWGIHPTNGISTSPMFYSTMQQNGMSLSPDDKIEERKPIYIGNDVFIGMNVTVLDGVTIGDGAVIGAGAVVSKDVPPYAIAVGSPLKILKYRFTPQQINSLLAIKWWNFSDKDLQEIEADFFNIDQFISKHVTPKS